VSKTFDQRNHDWIKTRVGEIENEIVRLKTRLARLDADGQNTGPTCRLLAVMTEYLFVMEIRQNTVLTRLSTNE
jgi:hypothetical protein